jgi:hypothetical protein
MCPGGYPIRADADQPEFHQRLFSSVIPVRAQRGPWGPPLGFVRARRPDRKGSDNDGRWLTTVQEIFHGK